MKSLLIAIFPAVSLFFAGCGQESAQNTSVSSTPSPSPEQAVREANTEATPYSSVGQAAMTSNTAPSPSPSPTALAFKSKEATQAANQYLNTYNTLLNDLNAKATTKGMDPEAAKNAAMDHLKKVEQDTFELQNQERQVKQVLTPDEIKRLLQYRKGFEDAATQTDSDSGL
jgi:hypothetical protein